MENIDITLERAIHEKDIKKIRNILTTSMVEDPGFSKGVFEEWLKRCLVSGILKQDLFEPFVDPAINENPNEWTKDYYAEQRTKFRHNFSLERLEHLKKVGRKLYPSASSSNYEEIKKKYEEQTSRGDGRESDFPKWLIPAAIGAAALALLWILFG